MVSHAPQPGECRLVQGPAAALAQLALLGVVMSALYYKRYKEVPQRPWSVWSLDVSKQAFSSLAAHLCSILISIIAHTAAPKATECAWYWVVFTVDTLLGTALAVVFHNSIVALAQQQHREHGKGLQPHRQSWVAYLWWCIKDSGDYGSPPSYAKWGVQLVEWLTANVVSRFVCGLVIVPLTPLLQAVSALLDWVFAGHPNVLLFAVMVLWPTVMNAGQALVQDQVLKWKRRGASGAGAHGGADEGGESDDVSLLPLGTAGRGSPTAAAACTV